MPDAPSPRPPVNAWFSQPAADRLAFVMEMMRELSRQTEPADAVRVYGEWVRKISNADARISLSRRGLDRPNVRVTSSPATGRGLDPWSQRDQLPILEGGLLSDLIWKGEAVLLNDVRIDPADPSAGHLAGVRSLAAIPLFDGGEAVNMIVLGRFDAGAFTDDHFAENVWLSNLFGRSTSNLVTKKELEVTTARLERQMHSVGEIQRSLLPATLPTGGGIDAAAYYETSELAGGDYYDFVDFPDGKLGLLIADVSGHGTPAAVIMAVTHAISHAWGGYTGSPADFLTFVNRQLATQYTKNTGTFVTAFAGVFDPATRRLAYCSAGHNPPRVKRADGGPAGILEAAPALPLGIDADEPYADAFQIIAKGDTLVLYTDGITEARSPDGELFNTDRLDAAVQACDTSAEALIACVMDHVATFTKNAPPQDDRTLLVLRM